MGYIIPKNPKNPKMFRFVSFVVSLLPNSRFVSSRKGNKEEWCAKGSHKIQMRRVPRGSDNCVNVGTREKAGNKGKPVFCRMIFWVGRVLCFFKNGLIGEFVSLTDLFLKYFGDWKFHHFAVTRWLHLFCTFWRFETFFCPIKLLEKFQWWEYKGHFYT